MEHEKQLKCSTSSGSDFESHASEVQFDLDSWKYKPLSLYSRTSQLGEISTKNMPKKPTAVKVDFNVGHLCRVCLISKSIRACCDSKNSEWLFGNSSETHPQELWEVLTQTQTQLAFCSKQTCLFLFLSIFCGITKLHGFLLWNSLVKDCPNLQWEGHYPAAFGCCSNKTHLY